jgi:hypothetical protein
MPHQDGWQVKRDGNLKASHVAETKKEAEKIARKVSNNQNTELQIHGKDMKIQNSDSHGNDPFPPKDKK